jgi:PhzF family phenazine biosynthesis protein
MLIQEIQCFGADRSSGNRALVVEQDSLTADERVAFAAMARRPACVFVSDDGVLDFIYPHGRSPLCLHATLAAARVLFMRQIHDQAITVRTAARQQPLVLTREEARYFVALGEQAAPSAEPDASRIAALLRCDPSALGRRIGVRSVGSPKLLVEVRDRHALHELDPDLHAIAAWGKQQGVNGIYAFSESDTGAIDGRNFNHLDPALEDGATGVAAGALALLLGRDVSVHQGSHLGNPCLLRAQLDTEKREVKVGGLAAPSRAGEILHDLEGLEAHTREHAVGRVNELDAIIAIPALLRRLDDEDAQVRNIARMMFQRLQTPDNAGAFAFFLPAIEALRHRGRGVVFAAVDVTLAYLQRAA